MNAVDQFQALFAEDIFQALLLAEIDEDKAAALTLKIYQRIQRNWGGCEVYIPTGNILEKMDRNSQPKPRSGLSLARMDLSVTGRPRRGQRSCPTSSAP